MITNLSLWAIERIHQFTWQINPFMNRLDAHLRKWAWGYLPACALLMAFPYFFTLTINVTTSLPGTLYIVEKTVTPRKGEFAAFHYGGDRFYQHNASFLKIMKGVPGDVVTATDARNGYHNLFINGEYVGTAKPLSKHGLPLKVAQTGVLPHDHYYMMGTSPDSLDSRYSDVGWVGSSAIIGKAIKVF